MPKLHPELLFICLLFTISKCCLVLTVSTPHSWTPVPDCEHQNYFSQCRRLKPNSNWLRQTKWRQVVDSSVGASPTRGFRCLTTAPGLHISHSSELPPSPLPASQEVTKWLPGALDVDSPRRKNTHLHCDDPKEPSTGPSVVHAHLGSEGWEESGQPCQDHVD